LLDNLGKWKPKRFLDELMLTVIFNKLEMINSMKYFLLLTFSVLSITCFSQNWPSNEFISKYNYEKVVSESTGLHASPNFTPAMYPKGNEGINNFIKSEIKLPITQKKPKNGGLVILSYIVNREGNIGDVQVIQSAGEEYDEEAIRVIKKMERWIPAKLSNREINIRFAIPITFL
jgi:TonB family protein